jgi:hypothetical protein
MIGWAEVRERLSFSDHVRFVPRGLSTGALGVAVDFCFVICGLINIQLAIYDLYSFSKIQP